MHLRGSHRLVIVASLISYLYLPEFQRGHSNWVEICSVKLNHALCVWVVDAT